MDLAPIADLSSKSSRECGGLLRDGAQLSRQEVPAARELAELAAEVEGYRQQREQHQQHIRTLGKACPPALVILPNTTSRNEDLTVASCESPARSPAFASDISALRAELEERCSQLQKRLDAHALEATERLRALADEVAACHRDNTSTPSSGEEDEEAEPEAVHEEEEEEEEEKDFLKDRVEALESAVSLLQLQAEDLRPELAQETWRLELDHASKALHAQVSKVHDELHVLASTLHGQVRGLQEDLTSFSSPRSKDSNSQPDPHVMEAFDDLAEATRREAEDRYRIISTASALAPEVASLRNELGLLQLEFSKANIEALRQQVAKSSMHFGKEIHALRDDLQSSRDDLTQKVDKLREDSETESARRKKDWEEHVSALITMTRDELQAKDSVLVETVKAETSDARRAIDEAMKVAAMADAQLSKARSYLAQVQEQASTTIDRVAQADLAIQAAAKSAADATTAAELASRSASQITVASEEASAQREAAAKSAADAATAAELASRSANQATAVSEEASAQQKAVKQQILALMAQITEAENVRHHLGESSPPLANGITPASGSKPPALTQSVSGSMTRAEGSVSPLTETTASGAITAPVAAPSQVKSSGRALSTTYGVVSPFHSPRMSTASVSSLLPNTSELVNGPSVLESSRKSCFAEVPRTSSGLHAVALKPRSLPGSFVAPIPIHLATSSVTGPRRQSSADEILRATQPQRRVSQPGMAISLSSGAIPKSQPIVRQGRLPFSAPMTGHP